MSAPDPKLRTAQAAEYLGVSASFLEKLRVSGGGPPYSKFGRAVRYAQSDLDAFATMRRRHSTSDCPNDR